MSEQIQPVKPRLTVEIHLPDGRVLSGPRNTPVGEFLRTLPEWENPPIVGAIVNGELRELSYPVDVDARVRPVTMSEADGARIYRRSLIFLLEAAYTDLYPASSLEIDHSISSGGFFCQVVDRQSLGIEELRALEERMGELVKADLPVERQTVPLPEAVQYFQQRGEAEKVRLLKYRTKDHLVLYRLGDYRDYHHGYMVPSTGYLKWFALMPFGEGFVLRFPRRQAPTQLLPTQESPKMLETFRQYGNWLSRLGIESVGALNNAIQAGRIREIILVSEALHEQKIAEIAARSWRARIKPALC